MSNKITHKQKAFADNYIDTGNGRKSVIGVYDVKNDKTADSIASENLTKPKVIAYIESKAENAAVRVVELSNQKENLNVALGASKDILDRAGFKPVEKTQSVNLNVEVTMSPKEKALVEEYESKLKESILE